MSEVTINLHDEPCQTCTVCIGRRIGEKHERERIIKLLDDKIAVLEMIETGHGYGSELNAIRSKTLTSAIQLIKGEK
jgi:hypothetical protein